MKVVAASALACGALTLLMACNRVQWSVSRQLCGRIQVIEHQKPTALKDAEIELYRSKSERAACCSLAERAATIRTDAHGNFNFGKLAAGNYFVVAKGATQIAFPVYLETSYDGRACQLNPLYSFDRDTGRTELAETIVVPTN